MEIMASLRVRLQRELQLMAVAELSIKVLVSEGGRASESL